MSCSNCGSDVNFNRAVLLDLPQTQMKVFCDEACLRAYLGPDRPLSRQISEAEMGMPTPQHMVEGQLERIAAAHEKYPNFDIATLIRGVLAGNL